MPNWTPQQLASTKAGARLLDETRKTAPVIQPHQPPPAITTDVNGSVKRLSFTIKVDPMGAVRMNKADSWKGKPGCKIPARKSVVRYREYKSKIQASVGKVDLPDGIEEKFFIAMPDSWSKKKKAEMNGKPHRQRPDRDNLDKAIMDALFEEDGGVWVGVQEKRWCYSGEQRVELVFVYF